MRIEDHFLISAPPNVVWTTLIEPTVVAPCVPGCDSVETVSPTKYRAAIKVAVGPINAIFKVVIEIVEQQPHAHMRITTRGEEGSKASLVTADSVVSLKSVGPAETELHYCSEVSIAGRLGKFGFGIMQKKAKGLGEEFATRFRDRLADSRE